MNLSTNILPTIAMITDNAGVCVLCKIPSASLPELEDLLQQ